jgi:hypothetical protein
MSIRNTARIFNPLNTKLNHICHFLALIGAHHILHINRIKFKCVVQRIVTAIVAYWRISVGKACLLEENKVAPFYDMNAYGSVEARRHSFLTSALYEGGFSVDGTFAVSLGLLTPSYSNHWMVVWVGPKRWFALLKSVKKNLCPCRGSNPCQLRNDKNVVYTFWSLLNRCEFFVLHQYFSFVRVAMVNS